MRHVGYLSVLLVLSMLNLEGFVQYKSAPSDLSDFLSASLHSSSLSVKAFLAGDALRTLAAELTTFWIFREHHGAVLVAYAALCDALNKISGTQEYIPIATLKVGLSLGGFSFLASLAHDWLLDEDPNVVGYKSVLKVSVPPSPHNQPS